MNLFEVASYLLGFVVLVILTQDIHIFPGAFLSKAKFWRRNRKPPSNVESIFIKASDATKLEVWRHAAEHETRLREFVAIVFHGNGGPMENFLFIQMWLGQLGIVSYNFDYRGFGRSEGWPNERGIYLDSDAVWEYVLAREKVDQSQVIIVGVSVGSAPAARTAAKHQPKLLLLTSAFTSLRGAVRAQPVIGLLAPFVRHKLSTIEHIRNLKSTHLLLAHAVNDKIVPYSHSSELEAAYAGAGRVLRLSTTEAGHNMAIYALKNELAKTLMEWL
jgi:uncharacterized protein